MKAISGRAWRFGDDIDTDVILGAKYLSRSDPTLWAEHVLEFVRPEFAGSIKRGDLIVAGHGFGSGSSREHAAIALRHAGIGAILAESFSRTFYRNAVNNGLLVAEVHGICDAVTDGDMLEVDFAAGTIRNSTSGSSLRCTSIPLFLLDMCEAGGLIPWLRANGGEWNVTGVAP